MSARAAGRLESLGFEQVYRYAGSKADWRAAGLPMDGTLRRPPRALDAMHRDTPTCSLDASVSDARHAAEVSHEDYCTVLGLRRLVLGRIRGDALHTQGELPVREVMEDGPTTVRADEDL